MDPQPLLAYHTWINLPQDVRTRLVKLFQIQRTGQVLVTTGMLPDGNIGGIQQQDGHSPTDLFAITIEKMQAALNNEDEKDFHILWNGILENLDQIMPPSVVEQAIDQPQTPVEEPKPTDTFVPRDPEELLKKSQEEVVEQPKPEEHAKAKKGRPAKTK